MLSVVIDRDVTLSLHHEAQPATTILACSRRVRLETHTPTHGHSLLLVRPRRPPKGLFWPPSSLAAPRPPQPPALSVRYVCMPREGRTQSVKALNQDVTIESSLPRAPPSRVTLFVNSYSLIDFLGGGPLFGAATLDRNVAVLFCVCFVAALVRTLRAAYPRAAKSTSRCAAVARASLTLSPPRRS